MKKFLKIAIGVTIIGAFAYAYRGPIQTLITRLQVLFLPCQNPITYKVEAFDTRFGISKDYFLRALRDAEAIWEKPISRELFVYKQDGDLKINLIYDYRQQATVALQKIGLTVRDDKASYDAAQVKYQALKVQYGEDKAAFEAKLADYQLRQSAYKKDVAYWNANHGISKDEYDRLNAERVALNAEAVELNQIQVHLNEEVDTINALVDVLNRLAATLNIQVSKYNTIGEARGSEFREGDYQSGPSGQQIDIYEFESRGKLVRVLAHEFGHALGLAHSEDPNAIMYRLNNGINSKLTATDLAALKSLCGLPTGQAGIK